MRSWIAVVCSWRNGSLAAVSKMGSWVYFVSQLYFGFLKILLLWMNRIIGNKASKMIIYGRICYTCTRTLFEYWMRKTVSC